MAHARQSAPPRPAAPPAADVADALLTALEKKGIDFGGLRSDIDELRSSTADLKEENRKLREAQVDLVGTINTLREQVAAATARGGGALRGGGGGEEEQARGVSAMRDIWDNPEWRFRLLEPELFQFRVLLSAHVGPFAEACYKMYMKDLHHGTTIDFERIGMYLATFAACNDKVEQSELTKARADNHLLLRTGLRKLLSSKPTASECTKLFGSARRSIVRVKNSKHKVLLCDSALYRQDDDDDDDDDHDHDPVIKFNKRRDRLLSPHRGHASSASAVVPICEAFFDLNRSTGKPSFPSSGLERLAMDILQDYQPNSEAYTQYILAQAIVLVLSVKYTREARIGGARAKWGLAALPDHDELSAKIAEILNWMANPDLCPSDDPAIKEYQNQTKYTPPPPKASSPTRKRTRRKRGSCSVEMGDDLD